MATPSTTPPDRRTRKRLATRRRISDVATRLFFERGFDRVTVDEIAEAADVGRMTVFNHFPRKEDMFFDRDQEARDALLVAVRERPPGVAPAEALRLWAQRSIAEDRPYVRFLDRSRSFVETVAASEALKARARAIRDEVVRTLAAALAEAAGRPAGDSDAHLAAGILTATWSVAFLEAHGAFRRDGGGEAAKATFLAIVDRGSRGLAAALAGTPYVGWAGSAAPPPSAPRRGPTDGRFASDVVGRPRRSSFLPRRCRSSLGTPSSFGLAASARSDADRSDLSQARVPTSAVKALVARRRGTGCVARPRAMRERRPSPRGRSTRR